MNREQKAAAVAEIAEQIKESEAVFAVDYRGITRHAGRGAARQAARRRRDLPRRQEHAHRACRRRRRAPRRSRSCSTGPTALTFVRGDAATAAKAISTFNKETELLAFKGGIMDGETLRGRPDPGDRQAALARGAVRPARRHRRRADHRPRTQPRRAARRTGDRARPGAGEEGVRRAAGGRGACRRSRAGGTRGSGRGDR